MAEGQGVIGTVEEDGRPVIWRFLDVTPSDEQRQQLQWLTVISWPYDREVRNGMPSEDVNERMIRLEDAIEDGVVADGFCYALSSRTGNGLKELNYYVNDRDAFLERFNSALEGHPRYDIEITFYHDPEWQELSEVEAIATCGPFRFTRDEAMYAHGEELCTPGVGCTTMGGHIFGFLPAGPTVKLGP